MSLRLAILATLLLVTADHPLDGRLGDLAYDAGRWRAEGGPARFTFTCVGRKCETEEEENFSAEIEQGGHCTTAEGRPKIRLPSAFRDSRSSVIRRGELEIIVTTGWSGCRNARPPSIVACTTYKGRTYHLTQLVAGCGGGPGFSGGLEQFLTEVEGR
ncbi:hypothetical protein BH11PSE2_BH11PSE2_02650 [soil metagenome]